MMNRPPTIAGWLAAAALLGLPTQSAAAIDAPLAMMASAPAVRDVPTVRLRAGETAVLNRYAMALAGDAVQLEVAGQSGGVLELRPPGGGAESRCALPLREGRAQLSQSSIDETRKKARSKRRKDRPKGIKVDDLDRCRTMLPLTVGTYEVVTGAASFTLEVQELTLTAPVEYTRLGSMVTLQPLPPEVDAGAPYYVREGDGHWRVGPVLQQDPQTGGLQIPVALEAAVRKSVLQGTALELLLVAGGTPLLATLAQKEEEVVVPPSGSEEGAGGFDFEQACEQELAEFERPDGAPPPPLSSRGEPANERQKRRWANRDRRRARNRAVRQEWEYLVCVDFTHTKNPRVRIRTTRPGADPEAEQGGGHLFAGRDVIVRVWHRQGTNVEANLGGTTGFRSFTYVPDVFTAQGDDREFGEAAAPVEPEPYGRRFSGRKADDKPVELTVSASAEQDGNEVKVAELTHPFRVTDVYLGALRLSLGASWAPWDRRYGTESSLTPGNPGEEIVITNGSGRGLANLELLAGYSLFFTPVYQGERTITAGSYFGLGVLSSDTAQGLDAITSGHLGLELAVGRDFGIGLDFSLRRTMKLRGNVDVGSPVSSQDYDRLGITPAFGVVLNLSPRFWKAVGTARKGVL